jgi:hypothetical protein
MFFGVGNRDGDGGFWELGAIYSRWRQLTGGGCRGQKIEEKPIRSQHSWDAGTEAMPSNDAATIEYDRWAYGTNV